MVKILFGILAAVASFMLVESLTCNRCSYGLMGFCASNTEVNCTSSQNCFTGKATFPAIASVGFNTQGCYPISGCNMTTASNRTILGFTYQVQITCCSTDKCNPVQMSGSPTTKMTLTAAIGAAVLASMWGSML